MIALFLSPESARSGGGDTPAVLPVDVKGLETLRERAMGRVLLVNVWATWCLPCVEEFPDLVKLRTNAGPDGLDVEFISVDEPKTLKREVEPFLRRMGVNFTTYIKEKGNDEIFMEALHPDWRGAVPATFIYDRNGRLAHFQVEAGTYDEWLMTVRPLLEGKR